MISSALRRVPLGTREACSTGRSRARRLQVQASFAEHLTVGEARPIAAEAVDRIVRASSDVAWARVVIDPGEQWDGETPLASSVTEKARS